MGHAAFYIKGDGYTVFIDPFKIGPEVREKADLILVTHAHSDHASRDDILRVMKPDAKVICAPGCFADGDFRNMEVIRPGGRSEFKTAGISAVPAYNVVKERLSAHPKSKNWVGYVVDMNGCRIYHAGDTDFIEEMKGMRGISASLLPVGGTFTMDVDEAMSAARAIKAEFAVPMHYKMLLGKAGAAEAEEKFKKGLPNALVMKEVQEPVYGF